MIKQFILRTPSYRQNPWSKILPVLRHLLPICILAAGTTETNAQILDEIGIEEMQIDTSNLQTLRIEMDAIAFFRDNEYDSEIRQGYSLPGVRLNPHFAYTPLKQINIEAGASMLFFNGANKYPCYAYHDIGTWKGNQYQSGAHASPWVRLQASLKNLNIVLGNIYGGSNHQLITPLFNAEQNISADPEMGVQLLWKLPHFKMDTWLNWQSYQFEMDTHQEAFTVGTSCEIRWNAPQSALKIYSPIQIVAQHRGGEQDNTNLGIQTIGNAALGLGVKQELSGALNGYNIYANALGCYQQAGEIWPFNAGFAMHGGVQARWWNHVNTTLDYVYAPKQFMSLYGNSFYNTVSMKDGGSTINEGGGIVGHYKETYSKLHNVRFGIDYHYTFAKAYTLGVDTEAFYLNGKEINEFDFSFGIYLRVSPSIVLKRIKE